MTSATKALRSRSLRMVKPAASIMRRYASGETTKLVSGVADQGIG
jgi:hypothetical protein